MKKKILKILAVIGGGLYIICFAYGVKVISDNIISRAEVKDIATEYIKKNYKGKDYYVKYVDHYSLKQGMFGVDIESKSSKDSYFYLEINMDGKIRRDNYEDAVEKRQNVACRLNEEYDALIQKTLKNKKTSFKLDDVWGELAWTSKELEKYGDIAETYGDVGDYIVADDLELDKKYDVGKIGKEAGCISIWIIDRKVTVEKATKYMLEVKEILDEENVSFYKMDFHLWHGVDFSKKLLSKDIHIYNVLQEDIKEEGLEKYIRNNMVNGL